MAIFDESPFCQQSLMPVITKNSPVSGGDGLSNKSCVKMPKHVKKKRLKLSIICKMLRSQTTV